MGSFPFEVSLEPPIRERNPLRHPVGQPASAFRRLPHSITQIDGDGSLTGAGRYLGSHLQLKRLNLPFRTAGSAPVTSRQRFA